MLLGVTLFAARTVQFDRIDPEHSRELFIRHALVERDWTTRHRFFAQNQQALDDVAAWEERTRRRDIVVDDETLFALYDARIPAEVTSARHFDSWWKKASREQPDLMTFTTEMLIAAGSERFDAAAFPDRFETNGVDLELGYVFDPGRRDDGVTVDVPVEVVNRFDDRDLLWQVPGFRHDLITAMIRALPKELRKNLAPAPDKAARFLENVRPHVDRFWPAFEAEMPRLGDGTEIYAEDVDWTKVPGYLRPTFRVLAGDGSTMAVGKDFARLRASLETEVVETLTAAADDVQRTGATSWADLPDEVPLTHTSVVRGSDVTSFPALVDEGESVGLRTFPNSVQAAVAHREGVLRLLTLALPSPVRTVQNSLGNDAKLLLARAPHADANAVVADCAQAAAAQLLDEADGGSVRTAAGFEELRVRVAGRFVDLTVSAVERTLRVLRTAAAVEKNISRTSSLVLVPSLADVREQFTGLVHAGFVTDTGWTGCRTCCATCRGSTAGWRRCRRTPSATGCGWRSSPGSARST